MENRNNEVLDWNDSIESDGAEYVLLPEGDYAFEVTNFERGRFEGSQKVPACNKASVTLAIDAGNGQKAFVNENFLLVRSLEWKISEFFRSIGLKKKGEKCGMDWNRVTGCTGRAHVKPRKYKDRNGDEKTANSIDKYYDFDETKMPGADKDGFINVPETKDDGIPFN